jgi:hypothetical protein
MRALSHRQASRCETAKNKICKCRCGGALHGAARMRPEKAGREREFFEALPEDDPHHIPDAKEKKRRAKIRRQQAKAPLQTRLWEELV